MSEQEPPAVPDAWWSPAERMMFVQYLDTVHDGEGYAVAELPADAVRLVPDAKPRRGDLVAEWVKRRRDVYSQDDAQWWTLDDMLDDYQDHADYGTPLDQAVTFSAHSDRVTRAAGVVGTVGSCASTGPNRPTL